MVTIAEDGEILGVPAGWEPVGKLMPLNTYSPKGWKVLAMESKRNGARECGNCKGVVFGHMNHFCGEESESLHDPINNPAHYTKGIETIDYIESWGMNYLEGNIIKYVTRYKFKGGLEDLKKAEWYIRRLIRAVEQSEGDGEIEA